MRNALRVMGRKTRLVILAATVAAVATIGTLVSATPAFASVSGCTGASVSGYAACVSADTGTKNTSNHTQWVGNVEAYRTNSGGSNLTEIWGDGFYNSHSGNETSHTWAVNKWVSSGTNICAAFTYGGDRDIACISISV